MTRWLHPPENQRVPDRERFDPIAEGARYRLASELLLAIWDRVRADATDGSGRCDDGHARRRFHDVAARISARGGRLGPDPGRTTRVGVEIDRDPRAAWPDELRPRVPGRETLVDVEARARGEAPAAPETTADAALPDRDRWTATGEPLPASVRAQFEPRFGTSLGDVRVHRDARAARWVTSLGARAATTGKDIAFAEGEFAPSTPAGDRLIAHELAHVLQHANRRGAPGVTAPGDAAEAEADLAAARALAGHAVGPIRAQAAAVARDVPGKTSPTIEFEVDPAHPNLLVHRSPKTDPRWIDSTVAQIGYTIWLNGFAVWVDGQDRPFLVPESQIQFATQKAVPIDDHVYNGHDEAIAAVARAPRPPNDTTPRFAYYLAAWKDGGQVILPTIISPASAPRTAESMWRTRVAYSDYVVDYLEDLALMMVVFRVLGGVFRRLQMGGTEDPAPLAKDQASKTPKPETPKAETPKTETPKAETPKAETPTGETEATRIGKQVHKSRADARRQSGEWDDVNTPMKTQDGKEIRVARRVNLKTGDAVGTKTQSAQPDAVSYKRGEILDDKPAGRPISKDRQEMIRNIKAYKQRTGELPKKITIERYDPKTGQHVATETYAPSDFVPP